MTMPLISRGYVPAMVSFQLFFLRLYTSMVQNLLGKQRATEVVYPVSSKHRIPPPNATRRYVRDLTLYPV